MGKRRISIWGQLADKSKIWLDSSPSRREGAGVELYSCLFLFLLLYGFALFSYLCLCLRSVFLSVWLPSLPPTVSGRVSPSLSGTLSSSFSASVLLSPSS